MLLSRALLRARYGRRHLAGVGAVLLGFVVLVGTDTACRRRDDAHADSADDYSAPLPALAARAPLLGDALAVAAACGYAASNVLQERLLRDAPVTEVLAAFGFFGAALSGVQTLLLESRALAAAPWDAAFCGPLAFFAAAMFAIYSLVPRVLPAAGAAAFNLHMLSSDVWAAAARSVAFGGFGGACASGGFAAALTAVAAGLGLYVSAGPPAADGGAGAHEAGGADGGGDGDEDGAEEDDDTRALLSEERAAADASEGAAAPPRDGARTRDVEMR
jgi:drug/metabolite transporter (DMT)-like permease